MQTIFKKLYENKYYWLIAGLGIICIAMLSHIVSRKKTVTNQNSVITQINEIYYYSLDINEDHSNLALINDDQLKNKDITKAYTSTVYKMLDLGDNGLLSAVNYELNEIELPMICIKSVYKGEDAENLIKNYCMSGDSIYTYLDAPEGCHWEAIKYDLNYRDCKAEDYVDIRLIGYDGNKLKYRGIAYPMRTYNIDNQTIQDGNWQRGYYVFYAVPNGCTDYALMCGDYIEGSGVYPAYYRINSLK